MMCCDDIIDLGCVSSCSDIVTNVATVCDFTYTITYEFNGALITYTRTYNGNNDFVKIPASLFNEDSSTTFKMYDNNGELLSCYKVRISPGAAVNQGGITDYITSQTVIEDNGCSNNIRQYSIFINFNDKNLLQNGSKILLDLSIAPTHSYTLVNAIGAAIQLNGLVITIIDIDGIFGNSIELLLNVVVNNCNQQLHVTAGVGGYCNLPAGVGIGLQNHGSIEDGTISLPL